MGYTDLNPVDLAPIMVCSRGVTVDMTTQDEANGMLAAEDQGNRVFKLDLA